jgi:hypothetical protein
MFDKGRLSITDFTDEGKMKVKDHICGICNFVCNDLYSDGCGHPFCKECIFPHVENGKVCPISNLSLKTSDLQKIKCIDDMINKQLVYCVHKTIGCEWLDIITKRDYHLMDQCKYETVNCSNQECGLMIMRKDLDKHLEECDYSIVYCDLCNMPIFKIQMQQHLEEICANREISCPQGCELDIIRSQLDDHIQNNCELTLIRCEFKDYNCDELIMRKDKKRHFMTDGYKHELNIVDYICKFNANILENLNKIHKSFDMYELEITKLEGKAIDKKKKQRGRRAYKVD